ncbi:hypothetical protein AK812_SmicGene9601 [Symbiodinium microadriaticum]|uniref:Uncharacterized protein n=1 Tax=Symbiodinium microadriaticum TaxID=2951 RepID=A0A1Q9EI58_SYMMI|nr:hypothetical protein AK812_SmicGene9601 [Symbiodinium microadriaticum]
MPWENSCVFYPSLRFNCDHLRLRLLPLGRTPPASRAFPSTLLSDFFLYELLGNWPLGIPALERQVLSPTSGLELTVSQHSYADNGIGHVPLFQNRHVLLIFFVLLFPFGDKERFLCKKKRKSLHVCRSTTFVAVRTGDPIAVLAFPFSGQEFLYRDLQVLILFLKFTDDRPMLILWLELSSPGQFPRDGHSTADASPCVDKEKSESTTDNKADDEAEAEKRKGGSEVKEGRASFTPRLVKVKEGRTSFTPLFGSHIEK